MYGRRLRFTFLRCASLCLCLCAVPVYSQILQEETLAGPDAHETAELALATSSGIGEECERVC
jgi:hypothetical protein